MLILDRFEDKCAVLSMDDGTMYVDRTLIHPDAREGDVLTAKDNLYCTDAEATAARREHMRSLLRKVIKTL